MCPHLTIKQFTFEWVTSIFTSYNSVWPYASRRLANHLFIVGRVRWPEGPTHAIPIPNLIQSVCLLPSFKVCCCDVGQNINWSKPDIAYRLLKHDGEWRFLVVSGNLQGGLLLSVFRTPTQLVWLGETVEAAVAGTTPGHPHDSGTRTRETPDLTSRYCRLRPLTNNATGLQLAARGRPIQTGLVTNSILLCWLFNEKPVRRTC